MSGPGGRSGLGPQSVLVRRKGAEGSQLGAEYVLLDPEGRMLRGLNASAARIWALLDGTRTLAEVAAEVAAAHEGDPARIADEVFAFAQRLIEMGLADGGVVSR